MFDLTTTNNLTMSSLEIADLVESRHDDTKRSIERLANRGVIELPPLAEIKTATKPAQVFMFAGEKGKRDSIIVVAQLSPEFTARLVDRWQELESQIKSPALPNFNNPVEAARAWADQFEEKQIAYQKLEEQNQKIDSLENLFTDGMTITAFCKQLNGVNTQAVSRFLVTKNWLYSDKKGWRVGSYARDKYLTEKSAHKYLNSKDEEVVTYKQELLKRGASRLHDMYMKGELPMKKDWDGSYDHSKFLFSRGVA